VRAPKHELALAHSLCPIALSPDFSHARTRFRRYDDNKLQQDKEIGAIRVDLNCLLMHSSRGGEDQRHHRQCGEIKDKLEGWFQIYDSLTGIVGELYLTIELALLEDQMKYDESATTVQFFGASQLSPDLCVQHPYFRMHCCCSTTLRADV
jgi:hypothetical protein